jgi:hypothetical protein
MRLVLLAAIVLLATVPPVFAQSLFVDQLSPDQQWYIRSESQAGIRDSRCGDDVFFPAGNGGNYDVVLLRAVMATNVPSGAFTAKFEVWLGTAAGPTLMVASIPANISPVGQNVNFEGRTLALYGLDASATMSLAVVPPGQYRWFVPVIAANFGANHRAYVCSHHFNGTANGSIAQYYISPDVPSFVPTTGLNPGMRDISLRMEAVQRPLNDDCNAASPIFADAMPFDTRFASTSNIPLDQPCGENSFTNDIWYGLTLPCTSTVTLSTCNPQTTFDTMLGVYGICPTGGTPALVACSDNDNSSLCLPNRAQVTFTAQGHTTYIIRVAGRGTAGTGLLTVSGVAPANDNCSASAPVGPGLHGFCNRFATPSLTPPIGDGACGSYPNDVFIPFTTPVAGQYKVTTCESPINTDTTLAIHTNCATAPIVCNQDSLLCVTFSNTGSPRTSAVCFQAGAGATYIARVGAGPFQQSGGAGNLRIALPGDYNADGMFSVQDIFDFLEDWNAQGPCSDFNGIDDVSVQDIFDFLFVWNDNI